MAPKMLRTILCFLGLFTVSATLPPDLSAQTEPGPVNLEWLVDDPPKGGWTVGDHIPLQLSATYPAGFELSLPTLPKEWGPFEVLDQTLLTPVSNPDGTLTEVRQATVTLWSPGDHQMPPLFVGYRDTSLELHEVAAPLETISVVSVLEPGETEERGLKPQIWLPRPAVWPWILGGAVLISVAGAGGWLFTIRLRRRALASLAPVRVADSPPAHEIAYRELERIAALNLPAQGQMKRHYTLVSDCLRSYVQRRYFIDALDRTTEELFATFRHSTVDLGHARLFRDLLAEADLVKFARVRPRPEQADAALVKARHIVDITKIDDAVAIDESES